MQVTSSLISWKMFGYTLWWLALCYALYKMCFQECLACIVFSVTRLSWFLMLHVVIMISFTPYKNKSININHHIKMGCLCGWGCSGKLVWVRHFRSHVLLCCVRGIRFLREKGMVLGGVWWWLFFGVAWVERNRKILYFRVREVGDFWEIVRFWVPYEHRYLQNLGLILYRLTRVFLVLI